MTHKRKEIVMVDKYVPQVQTCVRCGADELLGMTIHPSNHGEWVRVADYDTLAATLKVVQDTSIAHAGKQNDRIRALEAALIKIASNGRVPNESRAFDKAEYRAGYVAGFERQADIARAALATTETAVEREECPQCGGQGHIKVYADGVFQKAIDCGMCSAPNRGGAE